MPIGHLAAGSVVLADHGGPVGGDLGPRERRVVHVGDLGEERVVASGGLHPALDHVSGGGRTGQRVVVVAVPAVPPGSRTGHHRRICHSPGDDDVGPVLERLRDSPAAHVRVGGHHVAGSLAEFGTRLQVQEPLSLVLELAQPPYEVVAADGRHSWLQPSSCSRAPDGIGSSTRIESTCVDDDLHFPIEDDIQRVVQSGDERSGIPAVGAARPRLRQDEHGEFGQVVAAQDVDLPSLELLT